jgi:hypothetical protein
MVTFIILLWFRDRCRCRNGARGKVRVRFRASDKVRVSAAVKVNLD